MTSPIPIAENPLELFQEWLALAEQSEANDPNAMNLATVNAQGQPSSRMVLLKGLEMAGQGEFYFYTNRGSHKAADMVDNSYVALNFHWKSLRKQVRIEGRVEKLDDAQSDNYFASRSRQSQLGAWASQQSSILAERSVFEAAYQKIEQQFQGKEVPRPGFWGGYRVLPNMIEFWQDMPHRLHDRLVYEWKHNAWSTFRLYP